jgi:hypothetical protein
MDVVGSVKTGVGKVIAFLGGGALGGGLLVFLIMYFTKWGC